MSGLALSHGSILSVFHGRKVYQPVWQVSRPVRLLLLCLLLLVPPSSAIQVIYTYVPPGQSNGNYGSQLLLSDGKYLTYNVALHPHCTMTFNKNTWKSQNIGR